MRNWITAMEKTKELANIALKGNLVLFVGAGVSKNSKLPDWTELLQRLLTSWPEGQEFIHSTSPLKLLETYVEKFFDGNPAPLKQKIAGILSESEEKSSLSGIHNQIARIPFSRIYTTNYDTLLNKVFTSANGVFTDEHFADFIPEREKLDIIYLHGCIKQALGMRVTWKDFHNFWRSKEFLRNRLELDLHDKTFLFLGYSFRDPHLEDLLREFPKSTSGKLPKHYVVFILPEVPGIEEEVTMTSLQGLNIHSLVVKSIEELEDSLKQIADNIDAKKGEIIRGIDAAALSELSEEISHHIKKEDLLLIATYHENGQHEEAVIYIDKLLITMNKLVEDGLELSDDICFLLAKKVFYLGLSQKKEEARRELKTYLEKYPNSPWLIAEVLRQSIKSERDIEKILSELSKISEEDRKKVVLFDIFEISLLIRKKLYAEAEDRLKSSVILNTEKYQIQREILKTEILLARRDFSLKDPSESARICSTLKQRLACKTDDRLLKQMKNNIREIYSRSILNYLIAQPSVPLFSEIFNPFEDFRQPSYLEIFEGANDCVKALLKVTRDPSFRDDFMMRKIILEDELGEQSEMLESLPPKFAKETSPELNSIIEALVKSKKQLLKAEFQNVIELIHNINWKAKIRQVPFSIRLLLGWRECFAIGRTKNTQQDTEKIVDHMAEQVFSDYTQSSFVDLAKQLFICSYRLGCFENITNTINDIKSIVSSRPFSLIWLKVIEEILSEFLYEGVRTKKPGFVKYISLLTSEHVSYEPVRKPTRVDNPDEAKDFELAARTAEDLLVDIFIKKFELLPSKSNLLDCAEVLLYYHSSQSCWQFLTEQLEIDWDHLFSWAENEFPKKSMASKICYYLGESSSDKAKAELALKTSANIAENLGMYNLYATTKFALASFYLKEGKYRDAMLSFEECISQTQDSMHFLNYAALLLSENNPKRSWEVLQKGREVIGKDAEFAHLLFNIGFRLGGEYEREAMLIMQKNPDVFKLQTFDFKQDKDKIVNILKQGKERAERVFESYLWGKMPLIAAAENIKRSFTNLWLYLTDIKRTIMFRWPNPDRERFELQHSNSKEVVVDISSLFTIVKLDIQDEIIKFWNKIFISKSLWDWIHNEVINTQQQYMEKRHKSYQRFREYLGKTYDEVPSTYDFWQKVGKTMFSEDSQEIKDLGNHIITLSWARFKQGLWLVLYETEDQFSNVKKWNKESKYTLVTLYELFKILEKLGEISEPESKTLYKIAKERGLSQHGNGLLDSKIDIEQWSQKKQTLLIDYFFFEFAEYVQEKEKFDLLKAINRHFEVTISPFDLDSAKEDFDKHRVGYDSCNFSVKVRDTLRSWKQAGKLEVQESLIRKDNSNGFVSAEKFGVPWTEMAIATHRQLPFIVDDLGTFEMFQGFMKNKPLPSSGIPLIILRKIQEISDGNREGLDYWYGQINKLWQLGTFGMPYTGVLKWGLLATKLNINSRLVGGLLSSLTKFLELTWPSQKLTPEDFSKVGVTFKAGVPDPLVVARLSFNSYLKEVSEVIIWSNVNLFIKSRKSKKIKFKYPSEISKKLYKSFEEQVNNLENKIIENWKVRSNKKIEMKQPKQGDFLKLLPISLISNGLISRSSSQINIGLEGKKFLCDCIKTVFEIPSSLYSPEIKRELLIDSFAGILRHLIEKLKENFNRQENDNTSEIFIELLVKVSFFLGIYIIIPQNLRLKIRESNKEVGLYLSMCYEFIANNPTLPFENVKNIGFLEYESLRTVSMAYFLHLSSIELSSIKPLSQILHNCFESLIDMCKKVETQKVAEGKDVKIDLGEITEVLNALPYKISQDFLKQQESLLTKIGFKIDISPTPAAEIEKKLGEISNSIFNEAQNYLESKDLEDCKSISEKAREEMQAWVKDMLKAFDNYDDIKNFLAGIIEKTAIPSESQIIIYNLLARLYFRSEIKDETLKKLIADSNFRKFVKEIIRTLPKPDWEQEILEIMVVKLIVPVTLADLIDGVLDSVKWFSEKLVSDEWKSAHKNYGIILRGACLIVSYELCEAAFEKSILFENIIQIGQQITDREMLSVFLRETKFLLAILKGEPLTKLENVRKAIKKTLDES